MSHDTLLRTFLDAADAWVCDNYSLDIRYIANIEEGNICIWDASISLNPLPPQNDFNLKIDFEAFVAGQIQRPRMRKADLMEFLASAINGELEIHKRSAKLVTDAPLNYHSEMAQRDRWFSELHLQVSGMQRPPPTNIDLAVIDNILRVSSPPFDGLLDIASWLGLKAPGWSSSSPSIGIRVGPPIDLILPECKLINDQLTLIVHAHPKFDVTRAGLALRTVPGVGLDGRMQVANQIIWSRVRNGRRAGTAKIRLKNADNALAMLMIEGSVVRRQWFIDSEKARNHRLLAVQHFDKELKMIKHAVLESSESTRFENGVAGLLFLLGFTASVQVETDAPDLIVTTPGGKLAIVECTTKIADFATKVGKLVDRRGALSKQMSASGHPAEIAAVLICRLPRDQIAAQAPELRAHKIILFTNEDLLAGFDRVRMPNDSDKMLDAAIEQLARPSFN